MNYSIVPRSRSNAVTRNQRIYGVSGLGEEFNQSTSYTVATVPTPFPTAQVQTMFYNNRVGTYGGNPVLKDPTTANLYVFKTDEQLYRMSVPVPLVVNDPNCPCANTNCREEVRQEVWYASPEKTSESDIPVQFTQDVIVCAPVDSPPVPACADELAKLKASGMSGLGQIDRAAYSKCTKWCNDNTHGQDLIKCYKTCDGTANPANGNRITLSPSVSTGYTVKSSGNSFYEPIPYNRLSGLGEDKETVGQTVQYLEAPSAGYFTPPVATCNHDNLWVWGVLIFILGNLSGWLLTTAAKKR